MHKRGEMKHNPQEINTDTKTVSTACIIIKAHFQSSKSSQKKEIGS